MNWRCFYLFIAICYISVATSLDDAVAADIETPVDIVFVDNKPIITLQWNRPVRIDYQINDGELLIRTDHPLGTIDLKKIMQALQSWLIDVRYGYDSILFVAKNDIGYDVKAGRTETKIALVSVNQNVENSEESVPNTETTQRLEYLRGLTFLSQGEWIAAEAVFKALVRDEPAKVEYLRALAYTSRQLGNWREAIVLYEQVLQIVPNDKDARRERNELRRENADRVNAESSYIHAPNEHLSSSRVSFHHLINPSWSAKLVADKLYFTTRAARADDGALRLFTGAQHFVTISVQHKSKPAHTMTEVALLHHSSDIGFRLVNRQGVPGASWQAAFSYKEPDHKHMESLVYNGWRDQVAVQREFQMLPAVISTFGLAYNRYGLEEVDVATSRSFTMSLRYPLYTRSPFMDLSYTIAGEYVNHQEKRVDGRGNTFYRLPISTVEVHTLGLGIADNFSYNVRAGSDIGYAADRFGSQGFFWGLNIDWQPSELLRVGMMLRRTKLWLRDDDADALESNAYLIGYF